MRNDCRGLLRGIALVCAASLAGCAVFGPPLPPPPSSAPPGARRGVIEQSQPAPQPAAPLQSTPTPAPAPAPSPVRQFRLGPAASALVNIARAQERSGQYGLAAQTLERALAIEPRDPLVWIELGRESLDAHNPAQAYGMARKALYLANGDPGAQASAWGLIAAALRAQGQNQAAVSAEQKAAELYPH